MKHFNLGHGKKYRANVSLGLFEQVASNSTIAEKLRDAGFAGVTVTGSGRKRVAEGVWMGDSQMAEVPDQIATVYEI